MIRPSDLGRGDAIVAGIVLVPTIAILGGFLGTAPEPVEDVHATVSTDYDVRVCTVHATINDQQLDRRQSVVVEIGDGDGWSPSRNAHRIGTGDVESGRPSEWTHEAVRPGTNVTVYTRTLPAEGDESGEIELYERGRLTNDCQLVDRRVGS